MSPLVPSIADPSAGRDAVWRDLVEGNRRWAAGMPPVWGTAGTRFPLLAHRPAAAVLACADARVPVDLVFDQPSGVLYVVRLAGNPPTPEALASLQFAVDVLGVPLVLVLGHEGCGAMAATVATLAGRSAPGPMAPIVGWLAPAARSLDEPIADDEGFQRRAVAAHAHRTAEVLTNELGTPVLAGVYRLTDGVVELTG